MFRVWACLLNAVVVPEGRLIGASVVWLLCGLVEWFDCGGPFVKGFVFDSDELMFGRRLGAVWIRCSVKDPFCSTFRSLEGMCCVLCSVCVTISLGRFADSNKEERPTFGRLHLVSRGLLRGIGALVSPADGQ